MAPMNPNAKSSFFIRIQFLLAMLVSSLGVRELLDFDQFFSRYHSVHVQLNEVHTCRF